MIFIITLISLAIERFFHWGHLRHWRWFNTYQRWLGRSRINQLPSSTLVILSVLPPVLLIGLINYFLDDFLFGILKLAFGVLVLLYCFGPTNVWVQAYRCINQLHKEEDPKMGIEYVQTEFGINPTDNSSSFHDAFTRAIFIGVYQRVFAVVFWFVLLGPIGAVLYRSIALMRVESPLGLMQSAKTVQQWLDWIPVRIITFIFALGGHFTQVFTSWKRSVFKSPEMNETLLTDCGIAALGVINGGTVPENGSAEKEAISLLDRAFIIALVALAVIVLIL